MARLTGADRANIRRGRKGMMSISEPVAGTADRKPPPTALANRCARCGVRVFSVCAALEMHELCALEALGRETTFAPKSVLFAEDQPADAVFNVTEGVVRLYKLLPDGKRQIVGFALPGDFLGLAMAERYG